MLKHAAVKPPSANLNEPPLLWVLWSRHNRLSFICVDFSSFFLVKNVESMSDAQRWATARSQLLPNLLPFKSRARRPAQSDAAPQTFAYSWQSRDLVSSAYVQWFSRGVTGSRQLMTLIWWMQTFASEDNQRRQMAAQHLHHTNCTAVSITTTNFPLDFYFWHQIGCRRWPCRRLRKGGTGGGCVMSLFSKSKTKCIASQGRNKMLKSAAYEAVVA